MREPRHLAQLFVLALAIAHAVDDEAAVVVELAAEAGIDDLLQRVERFALALEEDFPARAVDLDADRVGRVDHLHVERRQLHRRQHVPDERSGLVQDAVHGFRSFAWSVLPPPTGLAVFIWRSAGGRTLRTIAGPMIRLVTVCWKMPHMLLMVQ